MEEDLPEGLNLLILSRSGEIITPAELVTLRKLKKDEEIPMTDQLPIAAKLAMSQSDYSFGEGEKSSRGRLDTDHYKVLY